VEVGNEPMGGVDPAPCRSSKVTPGTLGTGPWVNVEGLVVVFSAES
jgi:hypothetical protein